MRYDTALDAAHELADTAILQELEKVDAVGFNGTDTLYHYTNASGLKGIVETNSLWATNLSYVNDSQELSYGLSIVRDVVANALNVEKLDENVEDLLKVLLEHIDDQHPSNLYACSFTVNGDQLSQWRGYTQNSIGYSIGFDAEVLSHNLDYQASAVRLIYDKDVQFRMASTATSAYISFFEGRTEFRKDFDYYDDIVRGLTRVVDQVSSRFKHPGFAEETEYRLFVDSFLNDAKVREKDGLLIPYTEFRLKNNAKLPINRLIVGPGKDAALPLQGASVLLEKYGYKIDCVASQIPFRSL